MKEENNQIQHRCATATEAKVLIKMQPKSLELIVPLEWEVNKIKCLLISKVPTLQFGKFHFRHDDEQVPGMHTLSKLLKIDNDQQCRQKESYVLTFTPNVQDKGQFQLYYSLKMRGLLQITRSSPYKPLLHSGYYYLNEVCNKIKPQNTFFMPHFLNMNNIAQLQVNNAAGLGGGFGLFPQADNNNQGIFERGIGLFLRVWRYLVLYYLFNFVRTYISFESGLIVAGVVLIFFAIDFLRKRVQNPGNQREQIQNPGKEGKEKRFKIIVWAAKKICLIIEVVISFSLSLFPNWTIETHRNTFRAIYQQIQQTFNNWQKHPSSQIQQSLKEEPPQQQPEVLAANHHEE